ncbi:MAG: hypothetical protein KDA89_16475, partial [Planctomycetaceae bacterium]|nr:hypothetical protein [Planctomycetaceae bacterium]
YVTVAAAAQQDAAPPSAADVADPTAAAEAAFGGSESPLPAAAGSEVVQLTPAPAALAERAAAGEALDDELLQPDLVLHDRQHHVTLDGDGGFTGQVYALSRPEGDKVSAPYMNVRLVHNGAVAGRAVTNEEGSFSLTGMEPGIYGLLVYGESGLLLYSLRLLPAGNHTPVSVEAVAGAAGEAIRLLLGSAIVSGRDIEVARALILSELTDMDRRFSTAASPKESGEYPFGTGPTSTSLGHHQIRLQADGSLMGEINVLDPRTGRHREIVDMTVHYIRDGELIASTPVENDGAFRTNGLTPGIYGFVATGTDGVLAMSIDVLGSVAVSQSEGHGDYVLTSTQVPLTLVVCPVSPLNFNRANAPLLTDGYFSGSPGAGGPGMAAGGPGFPGGFGPGGFGPGGFGPGGFGPGGTGGGLGGGGGGFGAGGGLGALLGAAAAGALGYALGRDDASPSR